MEELLQSDAQALYSKHRLAANEIRLIHLEPTHHPRSRIVARMTVVRRIERSGSYHSLSYAWGSPVCDDYIVCDGHHVPVTKNLHAGLKRIREHAAVRHENSFTSKWFSTTVWADAICIDQSNDSEKASQVQLMASIYRNALSLIVWLGEVTDDEATNITAALQGSKSEVDGAAALQALTNRPWFSRRWVIQEVILSRIRHVLIGGIRFRFHDLLNSARLLTDSTILRTLDRFSESGSLLDRLITFRSAACANDLDRLYSLYSISTPYYRPRHATSSGGEIPFPAVDYTISPSQLFREFAQCCYERDRHSESVSTFKRMLVYATTTSYVSRPGLPSWVPDWSLQPRYRSEAHRSVAKQYLLGRGFHDQLDGPELKLDGDVLLLKGWIFMSLEGYAWFCPQPKSPIPWPTLDASQGEVIFYPCRWKFAFTLVRAQGETMYRLSSCIPSSSQDECPPSDESAVFGRLRLGTATEVKII